MKLHRATAFSIGFAGWLVVDPANAAEVDAPPSSEPSSPAPSSAPSVGSVSAAPSAGDASGAPVAPSAAPSTTTTADAPAPAATPSPRSVRFTGTIGAISLPRLLSLELLARFRRSDDPRWDLFAVGAGVEYLPPIVHFGEPTTLSWFLVGPEARLFVWRWLFAGARVGWQFSRADSKNLGSEVDYVTSGSVLAPKVGALYTFTSGSLKGFTIGGDLGATIPIAPSTKLHSDGQSDANARKVAKTFGMFVMPALSARVGWTID